MRKPSLEWGVIYQTLSLGPALNFDSCLSYTVQFCHCFLQLANALRPDAALYFGPTSLDSHLLLGFGLITLCYFFLVIMLLTRFLKLTLVRVLVLIARLPLQEIEIPGP